MCWWYKGKDYLSPRSCRVVISRAELPRGMMELREADVRGSLVQVGVAGVSLGA